MPEELKIDYQAAIEHCYKTLRHAQGTGGCIAFAKGAEWMRDQVELNRRAQPEPATPSALECAGVKPVSPINSGTLIEPAEKSMPERMQTVLGIIREERAAAPSVAPEPPKEKIAPVQGWPQGIPWSLHLEAYAAYCKRRSPQPALIDLEGRGCRGGFGVQELDEFIPGWRDKVSEIGKLRAEVSELRSQLAAHPPRAPLTDEQIAAIVLSTVYEGDASTPYRDAWAAEIGVPFARAIEAAHGIRGQG